MKGIPNLGNTCYFNSVLQCLLQVPHLSNYFILSDYSGPCEITRAYQEVVRSAWVHKTDTHVDPRTLLYHFRTRFSQFATSGQHDAQEALMCFLDVLEPIAKPVTTCKLLQETVCPGGKNVLKDETSIITVAPKENIEESLKHLTDWNTVERYEDATGRVWNVAATRTVIEKFPHVLILSTTHKQIITVKEHLGNFVLFASCVHIGTQKFGHYVAYTKHKGRWYLKDDLSSVEVQFPETSGHCILFYKLGKLG